MPATPVVTFDPAAFAAAYPAFASLPSTQTTNAFNLACLYCNNTTCSPVQDPNVLATLLNLLTAHICQMQYGANGQPASGIVGHISSATQGSVSVSTDALPPRPGMGWYYQTQYGAMYWEATAQYRIARYQPGRPTRNY